MRDHDKNDVTDVAPNQDRRKAIKKIATGVGVLAGCSVLPEKWTRPIVGQIVLPAHAETSGAIVQEAAPVVAEPVAETPAPTPTAAGEYNTSEVHSLRNFAGNNKQFAWLPKTGANYGGPVKFVFGGGCGELHVPNAAVTHGADGNRSNHNQAFYFCGTDFAAGTRENNQGRASVFAPPNCNAGSVTMYYNR